MAESIGEQYIIPILGVWDSFDDINFEALPERFVLKCTHDSESAVIVKDKKRFDKRLVKNKFDKAMKNNFYYIGREWPYKCILPRIIAEPYIVCKDGSPMIEYKIFCFNGTAKMVLVCKGEAHSTRRTNDFCDLNLNRLPFESLNPNSEDQIERPAQLDRMIAFAEKLANDIPHVRVDWYLCDDKIYFGEMTFYHNSGFCVIKPYEWDEKIGNWIDLPERRL